MQFLTVSGWFFGHDSFKCGQIHLEISTVIQCKVKHHVYYGF